jgi:CelD/BcsL family acetyltransferase involved in cellulose biosynthesis
MKIKLLDNLDEILNARSAWNEIAGTRPMLQWDWLVNWLRHQVEETTPAVLVGVNSDQQWVGVAPFCLDASRLNRKLRFLGSGGACTDYLGLITRPDDEQEFAESVADWLTDNLHPGGPLGSVDVLELEGFCPQNENTRYLFDLLAASGFNSHCVELEGCWELELGNSWDELNQQFSKSHRRKTKKAVKRLADSDTKVLSSDDTDFATLWPTFVQLHQARRQMLQQPGCFADSNFESFLRAATDSMIRDSRAEILVIQYQGKPLASMLLLNDGETTYMYQSGLDPDRISLEPGYQIAVLALQSSIRKGYRKFDFLRGDEPYKSRWQTKRIPLVRARFIPRNFRSQLMHGVWWTGHSIRQYLKS